MNEKALPVLNQYDFKIKGTRRVRGSYYCESDKGLMLLKEYENSEGKLQILEKLQLYLESVGFKTDRVLRNKDGGLISQGPDGGIYILKKWFEHRESEADSEEDMVNGIRSMAKLHTYTKDLRRVFGDEDAIPLGRNFSETMKKHNRELLKAKRFVEKLKNKSEFEFQLIQDISNYYKQAVQALEMLDEGKYAEIMSQAQRLKTICHGNMQYHNILVTDGETVIANYIRAGINIHVYDIYTYLKKCMEKNQWNVELAEKILVEYENLNDIGRDEKEILKIMFIYPEKFWKIVNSYYNSNKVWISEKNKEKLTQVNEQEESRQKFIKYIMNY